jgi:hypothetical protein
MTAQLSDFITSKSILFCTHPFLASCIAGVVSLGQSLCTSQINIIKGGVLMKKSLLTAILVLFLFFTAPFFLKDSHAQSFTYSSFFRVVASNLSIGGGNFTFVEFKKPSYATAIPYAKVRITPTVSNATIRRVIPVKIDPIVNSGLKLQLKILVKVGETFSKRIAGITAYADMIDLLEECSDFYYQSQEKASFEIDLSALYANGGRLYFLIETSTSSGMEVGVTYAASLSGTKSTSFSLSFPGSRAPF